MTKRRKITDGAIVKSPTTNESIWIVARTSYYWIFSRVVSGSRTWFGIWLIQEYCGFVTTGGRSERKTIRIEIVGVSIFGACVVEAKPSYGSAKIKFTVQ